MKQSAKLRQRKAPAKGKAQAANANPPPEQRNAPQPVDDHEDANAFTLFMVFNLFVGAFLYGVYYVVQNPMFMTSCTDDQPLVNITDNFLPKDTFQALSDCLRDHPLVLGNELCDANFKGTRGFVVKFNEQGIPQFRNDRYFECLTPYFDAARLPGSNAYVMNLLICELAVGNQDGIAVGTHIDNTIAINSWRTFVAHQVNVLYAVVPDDMKGGHLHVFPFEHGRPEDDEKPIEKVKPTTNRMVAFKGNAYHRVMQFSTSTNLTRVSLVLEQYKVPESYKSRLERFVFEKRQGIVMM